MTFGADNFFTMADFPGLWTVSNSSKCDLLAGVAAVSVEAGGGVVRRYVGFFRRGGMVDAAGFEVDPNELGEGAGLCELRQEPLRTNLLNAAWSVLWKG